MSLRRRKRGQSHRSTVRRRKRRGIRSLPSAIARFIARLVALAVGGAVGAGALELKFRAFFKSALPVPSS